MRKRGQKQIRRRGHSTVSALGESTRLNSVTPFPLLGRSFHLLLSLCFPFYYYYYYNSSLSSLLFLACSAIVGAHAFLLGHFRYSFPPSTPARSRLDYRARVLAAPSPSWLRSRIPVLAS